MEQGIKELEAWAAKELPDCARDKALLGRFVLGCKMRQDIARNKLRNFYKLRKTTPEWFEDRDPTIPELNYLLDCGVFTVQPQKLDEKNSIIIIRATRYDPNIAHLRDLFKASMMIMDIALEEQPQMCEHGIIVIVDLEGVRWGHVLQLTPNLIKRGVHSLQDCYPVRIHSFHFINCPRHVSMVLDIFKRFMRDKLKKRIATYSTNYDRLLEIVPARFLPNELRGTAGPFQDIITMWKNKVIERKDWFSQINL